MGYAAAAEKSFRQGDRFGRSESARNAERQDRAECKLASEDPIFVESMIGGVAAEDPGEASLRPENLRRDAGVHRVVHALVRVRRIVALILHPVRRQDS